MVRALVAFRHTLPMGRGQEEFLELLLCSFYTSEGIRALLMTPWAAARQRIEQQQLSSCLTTNAAIHSSHCPSQVNSASNS
ncbi:PREDICTED: uncharacterized protein LOC105575637 isoform X2 [Cercocebus atys]|uniref:uncharacterized protein LOC105575637 isoform X2 n=1 Tax=Cercocebus atys TaxID=9531 RepID=UPI0005F3F844|nr:PREDICTED: uncharacterized protein LOC105575637 isoform X2 [Cercocebus atys]